MPDALCNHRLSLTEFFRFASFFSPCIQFAGKFASPAPLAYTYLFKHRSYGAFGFSKSAFHRERVPCRKNELLQRVSDR